MQVEITTHQCGQKLTRQKLFNLIEGCGWIYHKINGCLYWLNFMLDFTLSSAR